MTKKTIKTAVLGCANAGKSTLLNFLIGEELLPSADRVETKSITHVHHDSSRQGEFFCKHGKEDFSPREPKEVKKWIQSKHKESKSDGIVPELHIYTSFSRFEGTDELAEMVGLCLIDLPGINESANKRGEVEGSAARKLIKNQREKINRILESVDLILIVISKDQIESIQVDELAEMVRTHCPPNAPVFLAVNKFDEVKTSDRRDEIRRLAERLFQDNHELFGQRPVNVLCTQAENALSTLCESRNCKKNRNNCKLPSAILSTMRVMEPGERTYWNKKLTEWWANKGRSGKTLHEEMKTKVSEDCGVAPLTEMIRRLIFLVAASTKGLNVLSQPLQEDKHEHFAETLVQLKGFSDNFGCTKDLETLFKLFEAQDELQAALELLSSSETGEDSLEAVRQGAEQSWLKRFQEIIRDHGGEQVDSNDLLYLHLECIVVVLVNILFPSDLSPLQELSSNSQVVFSVECGYGEPKKIPLAEINTEANEIARIILTLCNAYDRLESAEKVLDGIPHHKLVELIAHKGINENVRERVRAKIQENYVNLVLDYVEPATMEISSLPPVNDEASKVSKHFKRKSALRKGLLGGALIGGGLLVGFGVSVTGIPAAITAVRVAAASGSGLSGVTLTGLSIFRSRSIKKAAAKDAKKQLSKFDVAAEQLQQILLLRNDVGGHVLEDILECVKKMRPFYEAFSLEEHSMVHSEDAKSTKCKESDADSADRPPEEVM